MKRFICIFLLLGLKTFQAQDNSLAEKKIRQLMQEQESCWNKGNIDEFMVYYWKSDSLIFIGSKGVNYGWQTTLSNYKKNYPNKELMGELRFEILKIEALAEDKMYVIGKWQLMREKPVGGHFTLLWKLINGNWLIVCDHTS